MKKPIPVLNLFYGRGVRIADFGLGTVLVLFGFFLVLLKPDLTLVLNLSFIWAGVFAIWSGFRRKLGPLFKANVGLGLFFAVVAVGASFLREDPELKSVLIGSSAAISAVFLLCALFAFCDLSTWPWD